MFLNFFQQFTGMRPNHVINQKMNGAINNRNVQNARSSWQDRVIGRQSGGGYVSSFHSTGSSGGGGGWFGKAISAINTPPTAQPHYTGGGLAGLISARPTGYVSSFHSTGSSGGGGGGGWHTGAHPTGGIGNLFNNKISIPSTQFTSYAQASHIARLQKQSYIVNQPKDILFNTMTNKLSQSFLQAPTNPLHAHTNFINQQKIEKLNSGRCCK